LAEGQVLFESDGMELVRQASACSFTLHRTGCRWP
jgi:hypothetical protein